MGGIRRSFTLSPDAEPPDEPRPAGMIAGAPFEIAAPVGTDWKSAPRSPVSVGRRGMDVSQAVRSQDGLLFWLGGHLYRLRASEVKPPPSSTDIPIPAKEVATLLDRGARQNADDPALAEALERAKTELRSSRSGDPQFLLFETRPKLIVSPPLIEKPPEKPEKPGIAEEALTFIEIEFQDEDGKPVSGLRYRLEMPDSTVRSGTVPKTGFLGYYKLEEPGLCHLKLLGAEQAAAAGAGDQSKAKGKDAEKPPEPKAAGEAASEPETAEGEIAVEDDSAADAELGILQAVVKDADGHPIANHRFEAHFPDGTIMNGETDENGVVHLTDCPSETCTLKFFEPDTESDPDSDSEAA